MGNDRFGSLETCVLKPEKKLVSGCCWDILIMKQLNFIYDRYNNIIMHNNIYECSNARMRFAVLIIAIIYIFF
jgi:hypothetical protein